ncbi:MAG TPA: deoxyribonuclease IV [Candidatus Methylomirabilis sp.]|nr:deoxyribonuclease IV [Candidatus Methylomirabilis sp.]
MRRRRLLLGAHMSIAGGLPEAFSRGRAVGCDTIQVFTKNNNQWRARPLAEPEVKAFRAAQRESGIAPVLAHVSYLINIACPDRGLFQKSAAALRLEAERAERLGIPYLVLHPGAHLGRGVEEGVKRAAEALDIVHARTPGARVRILLETTAGQGTALGARFEELAALLARVVEPGRLGVCLDSCHVFAAGYEVRTAAGYRETLRAFDATVGLNRLQAIHLNDSKGDRGSRVDRHRHIGAGRIGREGFRQFVRDRRLRGMPMILETPKDDDFVRADRRNLRLLRALAGGGRRGG